MLPFRATPAVQTMRAMAGSGSGVGLFPRPVIPSTGTTVAAAIGLHNQRHFFLPTLQQRFASLGSGSGSGRSSISSKSSSASSAMDEIIDADIDISDPPEAVGASNAATARANRERMGHGRVDEEGNTILYASAGALGLLGLYSVFHENPIVEPGSGSSSGSGGRSLYRSSNELDPGTDARGRTSPLSSIKTSSRQHHDLPAHAPGGETIEFKLGRG